MLSASIRSQLDRVSVVFTICSILFLSVFEVVVFVFFSGCIWLCFGCISVGFSLICVVWNWFLFCCFVSQSASFPFLVLLLFYPKAFAFCRLPFVWFSLSTHSHTLLFAINALLLSFILLYAPFFGRFVFFLIITTMSVLIGLCIALRVGLRVYKIHSKYKEIGYWLLRSRGCLTDDFAYKTSWEIVWQ